MKTVESRSLRALGPGPLVVALLALAFVGVFVVRTLIVTDWNVTLFVAFGEEERGTLEYGERLLGPVDPRPSVGHDGRFFFVQANDPWYLHPDDHAALLDRPLYRAQRMLYPMLAGGFGLFPPGIVAWSMLVVNMIGLAAGSYATALVSRRMGGSSWWGLAFALNVGLFSELNVGGAGIVGAVLVMGAVAALQRGQNAAALLAIVGAVLSREVFMISAVGIAWWLWRRSDLRTSVPFLFVPLLAVIGWALYLRARLGWEAGVNEVEEIGVPFVGFIEAMKLWGDDPLSIVMGPTLIVLLALFVRRTFKQGWLVGWATLGFAPLALLLTRQVWLSYFDITRAVSPVITAYVLMAFASRGENTEHGPGSSPRDRRK